MRRRPAASAISVSECPKCDQKSDARDRLHVADSSACLKRQRKNNRKGALIRDSKECRRTQRQQHRGGTVHESKKLGLEKKCMALAETRMSLESGTHSVLPDERRNRLGQYVVRGDENTYDSKIVSEVCNTYKAFLTMIDDESVVLDLGANIGALSIEAAKRNAKLVKSFEPHPDNYRRLHNHVLLNNLSKKIKTKRAAITCEKARKISLYCSNGVNTGTHTILETKGRTKLEVPNKHISNVLSQVTMAKLDIEGSEYGMEDFLALAPSLRVVIAELHFKKKGHADLAKRFHKTMSAKFKVVRKPDLSNNKLWPTIAMYKRTCK